MAMRLATAFVEITARDAEFRRQMGSIQSDVQNRVGGLMSMLGRMAGAVGAGAAVAGTIKLAAAAETAETAFNVMLKDLDKTRALLKELNTFSIVTPFEPAEVRAAGLQLLAFKTSAEQIPETLQFLGDAAAGTGANFLEVVAVFNKVKAAGKLTGETFLQFAERGINLQDELMKMPEFAGMTADGFRKMQESGKISFDLVVKAMRRMTGEGGIFFEAMKKQSTTFSGLMSTVRGNIASIGEAIGKQMLPVLKSVLDVAGRFTQKILEINDAYDGLIAKTLIATTALIGLGIAIRSLGGITSAAAKVVKLALISSGVGALIVLIGTAVAGLIYLFDHMKKLAQEAGTWETAVNRISVAWQRMQEAVNVVFAGVMSAVNRLGQWIADRFGFTWEAVGEGANSFLLWLVDAVSAFILDLAEWLVVLVTNFDTVWEMVKNGALVALLAIKDYFLQLPVWWAYSLGLAARLTVDAFVAIVKIVATAIMKIGEFMVDLFTRVWQGIKNLFSGGNFADAFKGAMSQMLDSVGRMGEALAAGWNKENPMKLWKSSPELEAAMARQSELLGKLQKAKSELEAESAGRLAEMGKKPDGGPAAPKTEVKVDKIAARELMLEGGFYQFDEISKKMQEQALNQKDEKKETNKLLAAGNVTSELQTQYLKTIVENTGGLPTEMAVP